MKIPLILALSIASLLLTPLAARAVTDTWDGGGADDNITTGANWADNSAPVSNLASTDLIFGGGSLQPNFNVPFSAHSITFSNVLGTGFGFEAYGQPLNVGAGGIRNLDSQRSYFYNPVSFNGVSNATIENASGDLVFADTVTLPTDTLTVSGSFLSGFRDIAGTSTLNKTGSGEIWWFPTTPQFLDVIISTGTVTMVLDDLLDVFASGASIAVNGTSVFNMNDGLTLNGGTLTRASGAVVNLPAGKTLRVENGGDVAITGAFTNATDSTITVTGAGSTFTGNSTFSFNGGSTTNVLAGGTVAAGGTVTVGASGTGTVLVTGRESSFSGVNLNVGISGDAGVVTFSSSSTGSFAALNVDSSSTTATYGSLLIQSGATVTGTGLFVAYVAGVTQGVVTITGAGSALTLAGAASSTIGSSTLSTGALNVNTSGTFNSGTGLTTVRATGSILINGGTYNSNGDLTLTGGQFDRLAGGFTLAAGRTFTIQSAGDAAFTGAFANNTASAILVTGSGSILSTTSTLSINGGSTLSALLGADVSSGGGFSVGTSGDGTVAITDAGSSLSAGSLSVGQNGNTGSLTFSNTSTGTFSGINVDSSGVAGTSGLLQIESGAVVTGTSLGVAGTSVANTGTVTITGASSALTLSGAATANIGASGNSSGTLNVGTRATFNSGTGLTTVNATGTIAIIDSGTFNANGSVTLNGGQLTRDTGADILLDPGKTLTVQAGGDATFAGPYTNGTASSIVVTGAGSTLSTTGILVITGGSTLSVAAGGNVSSAAAMSIGTSNSGTVTVDGAGSLLGSNSLSVGLNGFAGNLTFTNGSTGTLGAISVDASTTAGTSGTLSIQSGATVTGTSLSLAPNASANTGSITITGAGSALTLSGAATATLGAASASTATVTVADGGTFTTGTGLTTVNATGTLTINAGAALTGASDFAGTGPINLAGSYLPGTASGLDQTTSVSFAQNMTFQPTTGITMELGGVAPGTQHDQLVFNGPGATHVTWNGTLNLVLINGFAPQAGQTFNLFDFDAARDAGTFSTITVVDHGLMPPGLTFNFEELYTTGIIRVVSTTGTTFAQWATASGIPGALPAGNHDGDGYDNLTEYALALFPVFPGAAEPTARFHVYPEGERMRVLFWRHINRSDITIRVQASTDLTNWSDLAVSVNSAPFTGAGFVSENRAHPLSEPGLVEVRDIVNASGETRRYLRILVTLTPL